MAQDGAEQQFVEKNYRWNFSVNLLDVSFYMLGTNLVARQTIMPLLMSQLTSSKLAIGLIPAIDSMGFLLPQLLTANYTEGLRRKLPFIMFVSSFFERGPYLFMALAVWFLAIPAPQMTAALLLILLAVATFAAGVTTPAWYDLIAKAIPSRRRGIWSGLAFGLGALLGIFAAAEAGRILTEWPYSQNFAICYFLAFAALCVSWVGLALNREAESTNIKKRTSTSVYFRQLPAILRRDANYVHYLIARSTFSLGMMATGFYIVYASQRWGMSGAEVGLMTAILTGSQALMNVLWGLLGDHKGHKIVLCGGAVALALAAIVALAAQAPQWLWGTFFLVGAGVASLNVSSLNIILEFCAPEDRPTYIGLTNTLLAPAATLAPLIGAALATIFGYSGLFAVTAVCATLAAVLMGFWVREPRHLGVSYQTASSE